MMSSNSESNSAIGLSEYLEQSDNLFIVTLHVLCMLNIRQLALNNIRLWASNNRDL